MTRGSILVFIKLCLRWGWQGTNGEKRSLEKKGTKSGRSWNPSWAVSQSKRPSASDWAGQPAQVFPPGHPTPRPTSALRAPPCPRAWPLPGESGGWAAWLSKGCRSPRSTHSYKEPPLRAANQINPHACTCQPPPAHALLPLSTPQSQAAWVEEAGTSRRAPALRLGASPCLSRAPCGEQSQVKCPSRPAGGPRVYVPFASSPRGAWPACAIRT